MAFFSTRGECYVAVFPKKCCVTIVSQVDPQVDPPGWPFWPFRPLATAADPRSMWIVGDAVVDSGIQDLCGAEPLGFHPPNLGKGKPA